MALPLEGPADLDPLLERIGEAHYVLLGEASHGTSEYYRCAEISRRLIREKGFSFIAVEGDWPDCYRVNRYVKGLPDSGTDAREVLDAFAQWPTWMWANEEVAELAEWLHRQRCRAPGRPEGRLLSDHLHPALKEIDQDTWRRRRTLQRWGADFAKLLRPLL